MKLTIGFSPCPNDTFIFDALVNGKIDTQGLEFDAVLEDVETLNQWALEGKLDITKLSFPAFFRSLKNYALMDSGSALGNGVGPLLIAANPMAKEANEINEKKILLPGINTTAHLLFNFAFPEAKNKSFGIFSGIEDNILTGKADLGVIIHENRFTYQDKGLFKVLDLGEYWENKMKSPIPLGGIAIKRTIEKEKASLVEKLIRESLEFAFSNYPKVTSYVKAHSQSMSEEVMRKHIDLYVNQHSISLGESGRKAILTLFEVYQKNIGSGDNLTENAIFLN